MLALLFWLTMFIVFYTYLGYGILMYVVIKMKRILKPSLALDHTQLFQPAVSFVVPCYNEADIISDKIKNCLAFDYPADKLQIIFITDGSSDSTPDEVTKYPQVKLLHESARKGKSAAENRVMQYINTPVVIFSDANTMLPTEAVSEIVKHYADPMVGAVSGEKRVAFAEKDSASGAGEGMYWKYESALKKFDSELWSIVGAAGELFSFRTELFQPLEEDTILDDFMLSLRIAMKGFRVVYEPRAYAVESASLSVKEELKRKVRIAAGGWQSMVRLKALLNPFPNFKLTFMYISHRVLRWSITPVLLLLLIPLNIFLLDQSLLYKGILIAQLFFYLMAMIGYYYEQKEVRVKILFIPFYFTMMNYAVIAGFKRYVSGTQSAIWEKANRSK